MNPNLKGLGATPESAVMRNLLLTGLSALAVTVPLILAHELMHAFGGALFGHGASITLNGANPQGLEGTGQWVMFAVSGTAYLFYVTVAALLAFHKWHRVFWLGISLAAGTVHQVGFFGDLLDVGVVGRVGEGNGSDPFHAGAILWNNGPLSDGDLPWRKIAFDSGWPSLLIIMVLLVTLATWVFLAWELVGVVTNRQLRWRLLLTPLVLFVVFLFSAALSILYRCLAATVLGPEDQGWAISSPDVLVLGTILLAIPVVTAVVEYVRHPRGRVS